MSFDTISSFFPFTFPSKQIRENYFPSIFLLSKHTYGKYKSTLFLSTQLLSSQLPSFQFLSSIQTHPREKSWVLNMCFWSCWCCFMKGITMLRVFCCARYLHLIFNYKYRSLPNISVTFTWCIVRVFESYKFYKCSILFLKFKESKKISCYC